ncbi:Lipoprotein [uncultured Gammaproteobacteria bacterium]
MNFFVQLVGRGGAARSLAVGASLVAGLALTGCTAQKAVPLACPKVALVSDVATATLFRPGGGNELTDVVARGQINNDFPGECEYNKDGVTVTFTMILGAERGPAMKGNQVDLRYFVALSDPEQGIISKREFDTSVEFKPNLPRAGNSEELQQKIPLPLDQDARHYEILVGFQLTPEQLAFNRNPRKR